HGGEPIRVIRPFLEGDGVSKPFFLSMTAAGQSALNVRGLDTVVIDDTRFANVVERGKNVLTRLHLGANELLQMAGRVHGRVKGGRVFILTDRNVNFESLRPTAPEFQLAGDAERVALTCAALGVRADALELPVPLDRDAYRTALGGLEGRGLIEAGRLTRYGAIVEALPVERPWAELVAHGSDALLPYVAVMASIESLHRMTREERDLTGLVVSGSDHLTSYNVYAEAFTRAGYLGEVYGLPRQLFDERSIERWAERRGVLVKAIEDAALAMASVYRSVGATLPHAMPLVTEAVEREFRELVARIMPFALVIDETTVDGDEARVSKTSVCGSWGPIAGTIRYFSDRFGVPRASIEGTQVPMAMIRRHAHTGEGEIVYDASRKRPALLVRRRMLYNGFELERDEEPIADFPRDLAPQARQALAMALAREEARHPAVRRHRAQVTAVRECYRRSGGQTRRLGVKELASLYETALSGVSSMREFEQAPLRLPLDTWLDADVQAQLLALPSAAEICGSRVPIEYDVESGGDEGTSVGVARLVLPERLARTVRDDDLPTLDRPLRFVVHRGQRAAVHASSLTELRDLLSRPWAPESPPGPAVGERRRREHQQRQIEREFRGRRDDRGGRRRRRG
ncbi:MAG: DEAD/DEAH box helicase, partial [Gemmatimonadaceae bacterium]